MNRPPVRARLRTVASIPAVAAAAVTTPAVLAILSLTVSGRANAWPPRDEGGQSTVEYALILLGAAAIALVVVAWVTRTDAIGRLFDTVIGRVLQQAD